MSETRWTPGPWTAYGTQIGGPDRVRVADTWTSDRSRPEALANAALVSSAPALYEACDTFHAWLASEDAGPAYPEGTTRDSEGGEEIWQNWWDHNLRLCRLATERARAALAQAHGETG